jgi:hypothetical protein
MSGLRRWEITELADSLRRFSVLRIGGAIRNRLLLRLAASVRDVALRLVKAPLDEPAIEKRTVHLLTSNPPSAVPYRELLAPLIQGTVGASVSDVLLELSESVRDKSFFPVKAYCDSITGTSADRADLFHVCVGSDRTAQLWLREHFNIAGGQAGEAQRSLILVSSIPAGGRRPDVGDNAVR